jgi:hypothetical protein
MAKIHAWWTDNRPAARSLFLDELAKTEQALRANPELGIVYTAQRSSARSGAFSSARANITSTIDTSRTATSSSSLRSGEQLGDVPRSYETTGSVGQCQKPIDTAKLR